MSMHFICYAILISFCVGVHSSEKNDFENAIPKSIVSSIHPSHYLYPPSVSSSPYSALWCLGGRGRLQAQDDRSCVFHNMCYNKTESSWIYYRSPSQSSHPILNDLGRIITSFPSSREGGFLNLRTQGNSADAQYWSPTLVEGNIPSTEQLGYNPFPDVKHDYERVAVLYHPHFGSNLGHVLGDDLFPIFNLLTSFGLLTSYATIIQTSSCKTRFASSPGRAATCTHFTNTLNKGISKIDTLAADDDDFIDTVLKSSASASKVKNKELVCFKQLAAGIGPFGFQQSLGKAYAWREFHDFYLSNLGLSPSHTPSKHRIVVSLKNRSGKRGLYNHDELVSHLTTAFPDIEVVGVELTTLGGWERELLFLSDTTVLITPCGGVSMSAMFLPIGASLIVVDYYDPSKKNTVGMEDRLWSSLGYIRHLPFPFKKEEVMLDTSLSKDSPQDMRAYGQVKVDLKRMTQLVKAAIRHVENFMIMGQE